MAEVFEEEELILEEAPSPDKKKKKKFGLPKGTKLIIFAVLVCLLGLGVTKCLRGGSGDRATVAGVPIPAKEQAQRVGFGNEEYNAKIEQYAEEKTARAEQLGKTWVPPISAKPTPIAPIEEAQPVPAVTPSPAPKLEKKEEPLKLPPRRENRQIQNIQAYLNRILAPTQEKAQAVQILNEPKPLVVPASAVQARASMPGYGNANLPPLLKPGDILYAINRVSLDSDAPGPSMVEIIGGAYNGAKALGGFHRSAGHLTLTFDGIVMPNGTTYSIKGYAIDPNSDRTAIRSSMDNHYIARYGGLIAASFLAGFGDAVGQSGRSSYSNLYGGGYSTPNYDINEELWMAAGKVGSKMADLFEKNWDMPPTVTLNSGTDIGILIVSVGSGGTMQSAAPAPAAQAPKTQAPALPPKLRGVE